MIFLRPKEHLLYLEISVKQFSWFVEIERVWTRNASGKSLWTKFFKIQKLSWGALTASWV